MNARPEMVARAEHSDNAAQNNHQCSGSVLAWPKSERVHRQWSMRHRVLIRHRSEELKLLAAIELEALAPEMLVERI